MDTLILLFEIAFWIFIVDRIGLWLESKGWLYWRKKKASGGAGNALAEFNSFLNPDTRHVLEVKKEKAEIKNDQGEGGKPRSELRRVPKSGQAP